MWPYTDDEAGWLTPQQWAERSNRRSANDNDPGRHIPPRPCSATPSPNRNLPDET